jgi:predicted nucleotidyltransferase
MKNLAIRALRVFFCLFLTCNIAYAQTFREMVGTPFDNVDGGSIAFADVDGDNDIDVLITGIVDPNPNLIHSKLYTNDGNGVFSEVMGTPFEGARYGSVTFVDIDGDNDVDVFITGFSGTYQNVTKLYTNDGSGVFSDVTGTSFSPIKIRIAAFSDIDGDNDQDVLITGEDNFGQNITKLYTNDGSGIFSAVIGTSFENINNSSIAFADVDGDNDEDVLITGENNSLQTISKLYTNNGSGVFSEVTGTPFEGVTQGAIAFADIDNDNDQDVFITGINDSYNETAKLYKNDGTGIFTNVAGTPFEPVFLSSVAFEDVDGDNDEDILLTGRNFGSIAVAKLYKNDGNGVFSEVTGMPFSGVEGGSIAFADIDGDSDKDVLILGVNTVNQASAKLYENLFTNPVNTSDINIDVHNVYTFPSPFAATTTITYLLPTAGSVNITTYNNLGQLIKQLINTNQVAGTYEISWNASDLPNGVYFYTITINDGEITYTKTKSVVLNK